MTTPSAHKFELVRRFARMMLTSQRLDSVLRELTVVLTRIPDVTGSVVVLARTKHLWLAAATPAQAGELHRPEVARPGPATHAHSTGRVVVVGDLADRRPEWPEFCVRAGQAGVRAVASVPLCSGTAVLGAVDVYRPEPRAWSADELATIQTMTDLASCYLRFTTEQESQSVHIGQLQTALRSRIVIEQAKGMLAAVNQTDVDSAFELLRRHARSHNSDLRSVAQAVVHLGLRP